MLWIIIGMILILVGIMVMVMAGMWGLLLIFAGVVALFMSYVTMMRGRGEDPDQGTINGIAGQGKQQSETVKARMPDPGEQGSSIWEKMEQ